MKAMKADPDVVLEHAYRTLHSLIAMAIPDGHGIACVVVLSRIDRNDVDAQGNVKIHFRTLANVDDPVNALRHYLRIEEQGAMQDYEESAEKPQNSATEETEESGETE